MIEIKVRHSISEREKKMRATYNVREKVQHTMRKKEGETRYTKTEKEGEEEKHKQCMREKRHACNDTRKGKNIKELWKYVNRMMRREIVNMCHRSNKE